ncbi:exodeoxyribonuclease VII small subunit [Aureibacillus halotolerans]|uniref:Exodeoxyribonuclease 7 small subunit n=1 Tax=Aureibacillus halotolerans TaxID=1508390 RepID=A0A4R6U9I6_9BACI|nr:exodeoxyribonuclease VII small subunit [Aureibacillus halotolerans]TDQ41643.1 exodeoxyribonuclease VII small subunit [Aureibacillus halotolerans]
MDKNDKTFEVAMKELEQIVEKLEEGDVPLEKAIAFFQEGVQLTKLCHDKLQTVEGQMDQILTEQGTFAPFSLREEEESDE